MARKKRKQTKLIEDVQFKDIERAKRAVTFAKVNQIRILIGLIIALIATGFTAYSFWGNADYPPLYICVASLIGVVAYLIGGGIFNALKMAMKITKFGWFIIPVFPADILIGILAFFFSIFALLCVPVVFVGLNYVQHKRTLDAAQSYLAQCGYTYSSLEE